MNPDESYRVRTVAKSRVLSPEPLFTFGTPIPPREPEPESAQLYTFPPVDDRYRDGIAFGADLILAQIPKLLDHVATLPVETQLDTVRRWAERMRESRYGGRS